MMEQLESVMSFHRDLHRDPAANRHTGSDHVAQQRRPGPPSSHMADSLQAYLEQVQKNGRSLENLPAAMRDTEEVALAAVQQHGPALEFASEKMRGTKSVVRAAVAQDQASINKNTVGSFRFAADTLRNDRAFVAEAVQLSGLVLEFASPALQDDEAIVLAAVSVHKARALQNASVRLRAHKPTVLAACVCYGYALSTRVRSCATTQKLRLPRSAATAWRCSLHRRNDGATGTW